MFEKSKKRYLTRGVDESIPLNIQIFIWEVIDRMPELKDYLQAYRLTEQNGLQVINHTSEQPEYSMTYILPTVIKAITAKVYIIDDGDYCTMLLATEY